MDEFATNWHNYSTLNECVLLMEQLEEKLKTVGPELRGAAITEQHAKILADIHKLSDELWWLRRMCDQHAG